MNFSALIPCFFDHLVLVSDFRQADMPISFKISPFFFPLQSLHLEFFLMLEKHRNKICVPTCTGSMNLFLLQRCDLHDASAVLLPIASKVCLNSPSSGSMKKKKPRNLSGVIELWFLKGPLFALLFAASDICFHKSGHTTSPGPHVSVK